ncbi:MAG: hypothetical protein JST00_35050 [Deltaproteobacteria bacterium]|nr:hypothetical protein [Deltaproteobacteria bacterium]
MRASPPSPRSSPVVAPSLALGAALALTMGAGACRSTGIDGEPRANPSSKPAPSAPSDAAAAADASDAARTAKKDAENAVPEGPARWKSVPRAQNGMYAVLDGLCSQLSFGRVGDGVVVHYGGGHSEMYLDGVREGAASFIALRDEGLVSIGAPPIAHPTGIAGTSLDNFWIADSTGSRSSEGAILYRHAAGTWKKYEKDQTNLHAWLDGGIIGSLSIMSHNGEIWVEGSSTKPPGALSDDLRFPNLAAFPTGDVMVIGRRETTTGPDGPLLARHWAPGQKVTEHNLDRVLPGDDWVRLLEVAPDEVYLMRGDRTARWDGKGIRALGNTIGGEKIAIAMRAGPDDVWVETEGGKIERISSGPTTIVPIPEPAVDMDGIDRGAAWMVGKSGKLYRRDGETWTNVPLPGPAFSANPNVTMKAKRVLVNKPDDVLLVAAYWEKGAFWRDQELHTALYRTRPVKETLRCNEPDPENNNIHLGHGFQSWPPMATSECKTPFAVLARRSNAHKVVDDWPRLRAALKGHTELGEVSLVEIVSGDRTFVGAKGKDLDTTKKIAEVVAAKDRLRPEIVCGDPEPKRTLAIDLTTGNATVK